MVKEKDLKEYIRLTDFEKQYREKYTYIAGLDEAGRGPLAGPVVVAAVIMPENTEIYGVRDSKKLSEKRREELFDIIKEKAISYSIIEIDEKEIDKINILNATKKGASIAISNLKIKPDIILSDALIFETDSKIEKIIKGDDKSFSIACASILAKVHRDRIMRELSKKYPDYGFEKHKGYGTKYHYEKIAEKGICEIHRKTFVH